MALTDGFHNRDGEFLLLGMKSIFQLNSHYFQHHSPLFWQFFKADVRLIEDHISTIPITAKST
jgi:hypothetical protein